MADAAETLALLTEQIGKLDSLIDGARGKSVASSVVQPFASAIARSYFESVRPELVDARARAGLVDELDGTLQELLRLATAPREKSAYALLANLTALLLDATVVLMKAKGERRLVLSQTEKGILDTLGTILPASADSYEQAMRDIAEGTRVSWRGTANELREVLREVMHHLAPDEAVTSAPGYGHEDGQTRPTQRQRVRYILGARRSSAEAVEVAEASLTTVDETVATLARKTYTRSNSSTHGGKGATEIRNLKRYIDALLAEFLAVS